MRWIETFEPRPGVAYALLVSMTVVWGSGMVLARGVTEHIPPIGLGFWRLTVACIVLLPLVLPHLFAQGPLLRRHIKFFTLLGILQVWPQTIVLLALNYTTAINATLINGAQPAITAILAALLLRDRMTRWQTLGIAMALSGIIVMVAHGDLEVVLGLDFNIGDWLVVISVFMWAFYTLKLPTVPRDFSPATVLFMVTACGTIAMIPVYLYEAMYVRAMRIDTLTVATTVYMGVVISAISIFLWNMCIRTIGPQKTSIFINLNPVFAALFAIAFLDEVLHLYHLFGALLVCGGITLVVTMGRRKAATATP